MLAVIITAPMTHRLTNCFKQDRKAFVAYIMGGEPDRQTSMEVMKSLPNAGVDIIELGVPFTDPMADGPVIEEAGIRAREAGATLSSVLEMAAEFRTENLTTPIILMGYCNPIHHMGYENFAREAAKSGIDGAIIVDLPPEEDSELRAAFETQDLALIRLASPTTDTKRLPNVVNGTKGFVYYVSMTGVTGAALSKPGAIKAQVEAVRDASGLPVVVGFGVKTPERAREIAKDADGVVVGTAIVDKLYQEGAEAALGLVKSLADATHSI